MNRLVRATMAGAILLIAGYGATVALLLLGRWLEAVNSLLGGNHVGINL